MHQDTHVAAEPHYGSSFRDVILLDSPCWEGFCSTTLEVETLVSARGLALVSLAAWWRPRARRPDACLYWWRSFSDGGVHLFTTIVLSLSALPLFGRISWDDITRYNPGC